MLKAILCGLRITGSGFPFTSKNAVFSAAPCATDALLIKLDSLGDYILSAKEIDLQGSSEILTYPNPVKDFLNFRLPYPDIKIKELRIFNISGQEITVRPFSSGNVTAINLSGHAPGIYSYCLTTRNNRLFNGKFVVSN